MVAASWKGIWVYRNAEGCPIEITISAHWPNRLFQVFTPTDPLRLLGLEFFTAHLSLGAGSSFLRLQQLIPATWNPR
jgi:hypothetical protein